MHFGTSASEDTLAGERREAGRVAGRLKVLADPTRLALLRQLVHEPTSVTELANGFRLAQPTVSAHIRLLREAGLLESSRDGARVLYTAPRDRVSQLLTEAGDALLQ
jgi:ArsR family transcriptional regulator